MMGGVSTPPPSGRSDDAAERRRLEAILASASDVLGVPFEAWRRPDGTIERVDFLNPQAEELLGYSIEEWRRKRNFWLAVVHPGENVPLGDVLPLRHIDARQRPGFQCGDLNVLDQRHQGVRNLHLPIARHRHRLRADRRRDERRSGKSDKQEGGCVGHVSLPTPHAGEGPGVRARKPQFNKPENSSPTVPTSST